MVTVTLDEFRKLVGEELGLSRWFEVNQDRVNQFADVTEDHQFIHVDPERARDTPFGGTVAHGFLTLSLLAPMAYDAQPEFADLAMSVNYGFDRVRFMAPVRTGSRIRGRFRLKEIVDRGPKEILARTEVTVEIDGVEKPALAVDWLSLLRFA